MQTNLNHCKRAHDMLEVFTREEDIAVALVSDPYITSRNGCRYDTSGGAAIAILRTGVSISDVEVGDGYVSATVGGVLRLYSCYAPHSLPLVGFETLLGHIGASEAGYRGTGVDVVVAGDFNDHSAVWGDVRTDLRGESLARSPLPWDWLSPTPGGNRPSSSGGAGRSWTLLSCPRALLGGSGIGECGRSTIT